jgi:hypothetical protein
MKQKAAYVVLVVISLAAVAFAWRSLRSSSADEPDGYPLVCSKCDHFFTLDEDGLYTHPKSPTGEGFKCPKCSRFGARIAAKCDKCGQWALMEKGPSGTSSCPKCPKPQTTASPK